MNANVAILALIMRWLHIASAVTLIGGFIFARFAVTPALATLPDPERKPTESRVAAYFSPLLYVALGAALVSGFYNYLSQTNLPPLYHMMLGIKLLFVLHIFAISILYSLPSANPDKRKRWLTGMVASGLIIIGLAGYLHFIPRS